MSVINREDAIKAITQIGRLEDCPLVEEPAEKEKK